MLQHRFNITHTELPKVDLKFTQMIIFDRKTNHTTRLKIPRIFHNKTAEYFLQFPHTEKSLQEYAKFKHEPQSVNLLFEQLYFQKTTRFLRQNNLDYNTILNDIIWE